MPTYDYPRVSATQRDSGPTSIQGVSTAIAFFLGRAKRGPDKPLSFGSLGEFRKLFGSSWDDDSYLPESIDTYFRKAGNGATAWAFRALGSGGGSNLKAEVQLNGLGIGTQGGLTGTGGPWALANGDTFAGKVNGGGAVVVTVSAFAAAKTGAAATYAAVTAGHTLNVVIGGVTYPVTFAGTENTQALFLSAINAAIQGAAAFNAAGQVKLQTDIEGSAATGSIAASDADVLASLGLTVGAFTALGVSNVANIDAVTPAELDTLFETGYVGASSDATASTIHLYSDTVGGASSFQFSSGTGVAKIAGFDTAVHSGSGAGSQPAVTAVATGPGPDYHTISVRSTRKDTIIGSIANPISAGAVPTVKLDTLAASKVTIGDQISITDGVTTIRGVVSDIAGPNITFEATAPTSSGSLLANSSTKVTLETFDIFVMEAGAVVQGPYKDLRMSMLSVRNNFLNRVNTGAKAALIVLEDEAPTVGASSYDVRPVSVLTTGDYLAGGQVATTFTDADFIGDAAARSGIYATDLCTECTSAAAPGLSMAVQKALADYGAGKDNLQFLTACSVDVETDDPDQAVTKRNLLGANNLAAFYYPWPKIVSPDTGSPMAIPPQGYVLGTFGKIDRTRGLQKSPAGTKDAQLPGAIGLSYDIGDSDRKKLFAADINYIQADKKGIRLYGSRTLDQQSQLSQVHHARIFLYLRRSLYEGMEFVVHEPVDALTRSNAQSLGRSFLENEWRKGTLSGVTKAEAFACVCDLSNNDVAVQEAGRVVIDAGARVAPNTEFVDISVYRIRDEAQELDP